MTLEDLNIAVILAIGMPPPEPTTLELHTDLSGHMKAMSRYRNAAKAEFERLMVDQPKPYVDFGMWMPQLYSWAMDQKDKYHDA